VNGPPLFIFEQRRVDKDYKQIYDKRERKRGRESSRKKRKIRLFAQAFFLFNECEDEDFCLRNFRQPENKITETEKDAKIAPIVLPSTAAFTCFKRLKHKNSRP